MNLVHAVMESPWTCRLGWTLLHTLWLGLIVAIGYALAALALRRRSAHARYLAGCAALATMLAMTVGAFLVVGLPQPPAQPKVAAAQAVPPVNAIGPLPGQPGAVPMHAPLPKGEQDTDETLAQGPGPTAPWPFADAKPAALSIRVRARRALEPLLPWVVMGWSAGVAALALWQLAGWLAGRRLQRLAQPVKPATARLVGELAGRMRIRRPVRVLECLRARVPMVMGWLFPVILLPVGLATGLSPSQIRAILIHELAHIRRYDYLVNLLASVVETLLFYHPAVWYVAARVRAERENCCDDMAVAMGAERFSYAESLVRVAQRSLEARSGGLRPTLNLGATSGRSQLRGRISRLLGVSQQTSRLGRAWPVALVVLALLAVSAMLLSAPAEAGDQLADSSSPASQPAGTQPAGSGRVQGPDVAPVAQRLFKAIRDLDSAALEGLYDDASYRRLRGQFDRYDLHLRWVWADQEWALACSSNAPRKRSSDIGLLMITLQKQAGQWAGTAGQTCLLAQRQSAIDEFLKAHPRAQLIWDVAKQPLEGPKLELTLLDAQTNQPLAEASVRSYEGDQAMYQTGPDGRVVVPAGSGRVYVSVAASGYVRCSASWQTAPPESFVVKMERGQPIGGLVQDEQGRPISGANVHIGLSTPAQEGPVRPSGSVEARTDQQGRWAIEHAPSQIETIYVQLTHSDYLSDPYMRSGGDVPPLGEFLAGKAVLVMKQTGLSLSGTVYGKDGKPLAEATVAQGDSRFGTNFPSARTDAEGKYAFKQVQPGAMNLTVQAPGHAPQMRQVTPGEDLGPVDFHLEAGRTIRGRVVDSKGNPIAGAGVAADTWRDKRTVNWRVETGSQGRFEWKEAPNDPVKFDAYKQGYMSSRDNWLSPSDQEQLITLGDQLKVRGQVVDAQTRQPIGQFTIIRGTDSGQNMSWGGGRESSKFTDGRYELRIGEPYPGYVIRIEAEGYKPAISRTFTTDEGEVAIDFTLEKGQNVAGVVVDAQGQPVAGAQMAMVLTGQYLQVAGDRISHHDATIVRTGPDGRFSMPPQVDEFLIVIVNDSGWAELTPQQFQDGQGRIQLQPWGRIEGRLLIGTKPGAGERIEAYGSDSQPSVRQRPHVAYDDLQAQTDSAGRFVLDHVPAGEFQVSHTVPIGQHSRRWMRFERVTVGPGQTVTVTLGGKGRPVVGKLAFLEGLAGTFQSDRVQVNVSSHYVGPPQPPFPPGWEAMDDAAKEAWGKEWMKTDEGKAYRAAAEEANRNRKSFSAVVQPDGSFETAEVTSGAWTLSATGMSEPVNGRSTAIARLRHDFIMPEIPGGVSDEPLDLGDLVLQPVQQAPGAPAGQAGTMMLREGSAASQPAKLVGKLLPDLKALGLAEAAPTAGQGLLVVFWDSNQRPSRQTVLGLAGMAERLSQAGVRVVLVHAATSQPQAVQDWLKQNGISWPSGIIPADNEKVLADWGVTGWPWLVLAGPDAAVTAEGLSLGAALTAVGQVRQTQP
jgi:beta-lactamase regulating signal transducer with metallopeptidase domain